MNDADLDRLLCDLPLSNPDSPTGLTESVMARLGPPVVQVRKIVWAGVSACFLSVLVAAGIALASVPERQLAAPPELTLLTRGAGPFASL